MFFNHINVGTFHPSYLESRCSKPEFGEFGAKVDTFMECRYRCSNSSSGDRSSGSSLGDWGGRNAACQNPVINGKIIITILRNLNLHFELVFLPGPNR